MSTYIYLVIGAPSFVAISFTAINIYVQQRKILTLPYSPIFQAKLRKVDGIFNALVHNDVEIAEDAENDLLLRRKFWRFTDEYRYCLITPHDRKAIKDKLDMHAAICKNWMTAIYAEYDFFSLCFSSEAQALRRSLLITWCKITVQIALICISAPQENTRDYARKKIYGGTFIDFPKLSNIGDYLRFVTKEPSWLVLASNSLWYV